MTRPPVLRASFLRDDELVVVHFAGGGGSSIGVQSGLGRPVDIAINHDPAAIAMHQANHPETKHYCEDVWKVDPAEACGTRPVGFLWASPDCTHFSRAKGAAPKSRKRRCLANVVTRWAKAARPRVIVLENVEEFTTWGPLDANGQPDPRRAGRSFRHFVGKLRGYGYAVEWRSLVAADYGAPTTRRRLFLIARCDGQPITWPESTHGKGRAHPWRTAAEVIDWTLPVPSIFNRLRPLADATLRRIAAGVQRYVIDSRRPFIAPVVQPGGRHETLVAALLTKHYGGVVGHQVELPLGTITTQDHHALTTAFLTKFYGTSIGADLRDPLPTVTASGQHLGEVRAFLVKYYGANGTADSQQSLFDPLHTITTKARFGLVMVHGEPYQIVDIGMRMLQPHELFAAQGFPASYNIAPEFEGRPLTKTAQTALAGNSVCPDVAAAIAIANVGNARSEAA